MKRLALAFISALAILSLIQSCEVESNYYDFYPNAMVTVKTSDAGKLYLQLDEKTALIPTNISKSPYGSKEVRAFINYEDMGVNENSPFGGGVVRNAKVNWMDSILTKKPVPTAGEENDVKFGTAPIEIIGNWVTIVEDGYMTLCFNAMWGGYQNVIHYINLLTGTNPDDPYELELRHNSNGDPIDHYYGVMKAGYVAFNIRELPDTQGQTVKLKLKYKSFSGDKTITFDYCTGQSVHPTSAMPLSSIQNIPMQ